VHSPRQVKSLQHNSWVCFIILVSGTPCCRNGYIILHWILKIYTENIQSNIKVHARMQDSERHKRNWKIFTQYKFIMHQVWLYKLQYCSGSSACGSEFWQWWLGVRRKIIRPVKNWWGAGAVISAYLSGVRHKISYGPADATANPAVCCFIKTKNGLTFLVPAYPGCPVKEAVKWVSVCLLFKWGPSQLTYTG